jgi:CzcA family heavy metal efflux pump
VNLARLVSAQSRAILLVVALLCGAGIFAAFYLPTAIFPQTDFPRIVIVVDNGVVPAPQMLASVTRPIEEAMNGIPGITGIRSTTGRGAVDINLFFDWKVDVLQTLQFVQARLSQLSATLPPTASIRRVDRLTFAVFPVAGYSLTSPTIDPANLRDLAAYTVRPRLARLPGVANVAVAGGQVREFHIRIDPNRLAGLNITSQQVVDAVRTSNIVASAGLIEENHKLELTLVNGLAVEPDQLKKIAVGVVNGVPITVDDIAEVGQGVAPRYTNVTANGKPAVLLNIIRQPDANVVTVVNEVTAELAAIKPQLPKDVTIAPFYDQSLLVRSSLTSVRDSILIGLALSVLILYGFLRKWGPTLVAATVIPITVLVTFLLMRVFGLSFDLMTLGGVAAAIGLVIDDAIVVVENIHSHLLRSTDRQSAIEQAVSEIAIPIVGSTITPIAVFIPLTLLTGVTGVFFRSLSLTLVASLLTSLVLALSVTPILAGRFMQGGSTPDEKSGTEEENGPVLRFLIDRYEWLLARALSRRIWVMAIACGVLIGSYFLYKRLGSEFLPAFDEGAFVLDYVAPPGSSLAETDRMLLHVEEMIRSTPEVESYSRRTGLQLGLSITEPNTGDFLVKLKAKRNRTTDQVTSELRTKIEGSEPALRVEFVGILSDLIGDLTSSPAPIEVRLFSEDSTVLHNTSREVAQAISKIPGVVDVFDGVVVSGPALIFDVDTLQAAKLGVNPTDIANAVSTAMTGDPASTILQQGRLVTVRVVMRTGARSSIDALKALRIRSTAGNLFRLDQVANVRYESGQTEIQRNALRQSVSVTARLSGTDLGTAVASVKAKLARDVKLPAGLTVEYGGLYREQQASFRELLIALLLAIMLVFVVLLVEFRSFAHPVAIVTGAVLALSGVFAALWVTGITLNVVSMVGMIMVVGIVAKNGILMLDAVEDHLAAGDNLTEALLRSGRRRFRPVLMTSLAAILGMLPLALALGSGAELLQPLAVSVIGGLAVALLLSLVVTPTIYSVLRGQ